MSKFLFIAFWVIIIALLIAYILYLALGDAKSHGQESGLGYVKVIDDAEKIRSARNVPPTTRIAGMPVSFEPQPDIRERVNEERANYTEDMTMETPVYIGVNSSVVEVRAIKAK